MKKLGLYRGSLIDFYESNKNLIGDEFVILDSPSVNKLSQYSYLMWDFEDEVRLKNDKVYYNQSEVDRNSTIILKEILKDIPKSYEKQQFFSGGIIGLVSYDYNKYLETIVDSAEDDMGLPDLYFVVPKRIIVKDEKSHEIIEINFSGTDDKFDLTEFSEKIEIFNLEIDWNDLNKFQANISKEEFIRICNKAKEYIKEGDIFQVNLSQRFGAKIFANESLMLYKILRLINPSPFASLVHLKEFKLISQSPERLVRLKDGIADTRPIAGTRRLKLNDEIGNEALAEELKKDAKECAEHVMLVDLERNDIGKVAEFGSVEVDELMIIERYSHVMHLVSNVKGALKKGVDSFDLLNAMFPGGTITGAPKIRAMEIIEELEPTKRGFYTGSLGFIGYDGNMDFNIIIRSFLEKNSMVYFQVGAGIVFDSIPEREYKETINKARAMVLAYENLKARRV